MSSIVMMTSETMRFVENFLDETVRKSNTKDEILSLAREAIEGANILLFGDINLGQILDTEWIADVCVERFLTKKSSPQEQK